VLSLNIRQVKPRKEFTLVKWIRLVNRNRIYMERGISAYHEPRHS
jgi:hypothetical protein